MNACPELHELLAVKDRPADDPGRLHLESCPRCRNRVMLYADFENPEATPPEADLIDAERRLSASLAGLRGRGSAPATGRPPLAFERDRSGLWGSVFGWLTGPSSWRLAVAGVVIVAVAVVLVRPQLVGVQPDSTPVPTLRAGGSPATLRLQTAEPLPDGRVRLAWSAAADAELYRVRVLGPDLTELLSRDVVGETELVFDRSMLSRPVEPGTVLGWNVGVFRGGGELGRSTTATLRAP